MLGTVLCSADCAQAEARGHLCTQFSVQTLRWSSGLFNWRCLLVRITLFFVSGGFSLPCHIGLRWFDPPLLDRMRAKIYIIGFSRSLWQKTCRQLKQSSGKSSLARICSTTQSSRDFRKLGKLSFVPNQSYCCPNISKFRFISCSRVVASEWENIVFLQRAAAAEGIELSVRVADAEAALGTDHGEHVLEDVVNLLPPTALNNANVPPDGARGGIDGQGQFSSSFWQQGDFFLAAGRGD